jgi:adenylyltransferase/sulfurtransferase
VKHSTPQSEGLDARQAFVPEELERYSRQLIMPEIGLDGQRKLRNARVLIVGMGGLGSPAVMYLAAAGVGHLGLVDADTLDISNLHRQIIHSTDLIGRPKVESAMRRIADLNPLIAAEGFHAKLSAQNTRSLIEPYDLVVDATDNFPARYLINDACVLLKKPNVHGSVFRFEGQASVFSANGGPCYRCLYPEPPPADLAPPCVDAGVIGVVPGIIGLIQATEAIKLILGVGDSLVGRLLLFNGLSMRFRELTVPKDPQCAVCGNAPTILEVLDYDSTCATAASSVDITAVQLKSALAASQNLLLLDVREPWEYEKWHIPGAVSIPLGELERRITDLDPDRPTVAYCQSGGRSRKATLLLRSKGFRNVRNLEGGILAWAKAATS